MKTIRRLTLKPVLPLLALFAAAICTLAQQPPPQLNVGDVIVAAKGEFQVVDHTAGTVKANLAAPSNTDQTAACADDSTFRTRAAIPTENEVVKYPIGSLMSPFTIIPGQTATTETNTPPLAIVFEGDNKFYVGHPDGTIELFDAAGNPLTTFTVRASIDDFENPLFFSLDVRQDGKTLDFTSGGSHIGVFDSVHGTTTLIPVTNQASITSFSITNNVVTFQTANNNFPAGTVVTIANLTNGYLNTTLTVLSAGLSATQFEAIFAHENVPSTNDSGTAMADNTMLYGIRELSPFINGSGGYVAAIGLDIANISSTGTVNFLYVRGQDLADEGNNWETLALDPDGMHFWATNLATGNLYEFNLLGGKTAGPFTTAARANNGQGGICVVGGFSAAQPTPIMQKITLFSPTNPPPNNSNSNTFTFTTPSATQVSLGNGVMGKSSSTNELFETMIFNAGQGQNGVTVKVWFIEVGALVGVSDNGVPCFVVDTPTPDTPAEAAAVNRCAIVKVESSADGPPQGFASVNMTLLTSQPGTNARYYSDMAKDNTTFVLSDTGPGGCRCSTVYSIQQQQVSAGASSGDVSCGYQLPVTGSPSVFNDNATFPAQFSVAATQADCAAGNILNSPTLQPIIKMVKLDPPPTLTGTLESGKAAGSSTGPYPFYRYDPSRKTWIINVKLSSLPAGCYIVTTHDNSNQIPDFSYSAVTDPKTVVIGVSQSCTTVILP